MPGVCNIKVTTHTFWCPSLSSSSSRADGHNQTAWGSLKFVDSGMPLCLSFSLNCYSSAADRFYNSGAASHLEIPYMSCLQTVACPRDCSIAI